MKPRRLGLLFVFLCPVLAATPPNIILLLADDAGIGDYQPYSTKLGVPDEVALRTPNVQNLSEKGMTFYRAHSTGAVCQPSRFSIISGVFPIRKHVSGTTPTLENPIIDPKQPNIAGVLRSKGYLTGMVGKWHLDYVYSDKKQPGKPTSRSASAKLEAPLLLGADDYEFDRTFWLPKGIGGADFFIEDRHIAKLTGVLPYAKAHPNKPDWPGHERWQSTRYESGQEIEKLDDRSKVGRILTGKALDFIETAAAGDKPFFLYYPLIAPHAPHLPSATINGQAEDAGARKVDGSPVTHARQKMVYENDLILGQVMEQLRRLGIEDHTIVIFTSDNGAGKPGAVKDGGTGQYRGFKGTAWEGGNRMPLIVKWPGKVKAGSTTDALVSQVDFLRTFADITGAEVPAGAAIDSRSFLPVLTGMSNKARDFSISTKHKEPPHDNYLDGYFNLAVTSADGTKLITELDPATDAYKPLALYDINKDPGEETNLLDSPEFAVPLRNLTAAFKEILARAPVDHSGSRTAGED